MLALIAVWMSLPLSPCSLVRQEAKCDSDMGAMFMEMAKSVISVLQPKSASTPLENPLLPYLLEKLLSYVHLQQMKELHSLFETGALTKQTT